MPDPSVSPADTIRDVLGEVALRFFGSGELLLQAHDAVDAWLAVGERDKAEIERLRGDLTMLRDAWNAHMETCPIHAALPDLPAPTWEDLERWRNAPSDTASGGSA